VEAVKGFLPKSYRQISTKIDKTVVFWVPKPWFRLYTEIMDDPKLAGWTGDQFRVLIYLFCLARQSDEPGLIKMTPAEIAWRTRQPVELIEEVLRLGTAGERPILAREEGGIRVVKFTTRQYDNPSDHPAAVAERVRRHRRNKKEGNGNETSVKRGVTTCNDHVTSEGGRYVTNDVTLETVQATGKTGDTGAGSIQSNGTPEASKTEGSGECNDHVTTLKRPGNDRDTDTDINNDLYMCVYSAREFQKMKGRPISPMELEQLREAEQVHGPELVTEAITMAFQQKRNPGISYVLGILRNWAADGLKTVEAVREANSRANQKKGVTAHGRADPVAGGDKYAIPADFYWHDEGS
jgi:DnaD/phage-associated family protein